jgi:AmiR/NasT family two-component response regulator
MFRPAVVSARAGLVGRAVAGVLTRRTSPAQQAAREGAAAELRAATEARALLARARAAIAATGDVTDTEAFTRLAQQSGHEGRSILAVARDVLASSGRLAGQEPPS